MMPRKDARKELGITNHVERELARAHYDAHTTGAGWLIMDPQGLVRHVKPQDVIAWAMQQEGKE